MPFPFWPLGLSIGDILCPVTSVPYLCLAHSYSSELIPDPLWSPSWSLVKRETWSLCYVLTKSLFIIFFLGAQKRQHFPGFPEVQLRSPDSVLTRVGGSEACRVQAGSLSSRESPKLSSLAAATAQALCLRWQDRKAEQLERVLIKKSCLMHLDHNVLNPWDFRVNLLPSRDLSSCSGYN